MSTRTGMAAAAAAVLLCTLTMPDANAQRPAGRTIEVGVLAGLTFTDVDEGDNITGFMLPANSTQFVEVPSLRLTYWRKSDWTIDGAIAFMTVDSGHSLTMRLLEAGPSYVFPSKSATCYSLGGVLGLITISGSSRSHTDWTLGPQAIMRTRINDHTVVRIQCGARVFLGDDLGVNSAFELAAGLGFFI